MSKGIAESDKNFVAVKSKYPDVEFHNILDEPFAIDGLYMPKETGIYTRLPMEFMDLAELNDTAKIVMTNTAGGKVRFITDSPYVALWVRLGETSYIMHHIADTAVMGFDMYASDDASQDEEAFAKVYIPAVDENKCYAGMYEFPCSKLRNITLNFPLYHNVSEVYVGLKAGCILTKPKEYAFSKPVVFYGSSITQGGCASRPGTAYTATLSRRLNCNHINLGFSGAGQGEQLMAEYIADMDMSVFVMDYDHNALSVEHLQNTHYAFYETVRKKNPHLPIIMMSAPISTLDEYNPIIPVMKKRRIVVMESYIKAVQSGDENVYFVDGEALLGTDKPYNSTVDGNHPTDYGFCQMADRLYPILKRLLYKN